MLQEQRDSDLNLGRNRQERSFSGNQRMADFDESGSQPPRDFVPIAVDRQGKANVPFPDGQDRSAAPVRI